MCGNCAWHGTAWQGKARQGKARQGKARQGKARQGKARQGKARQGQARQGKARKGKARQGKAGCTRGMAKGSDEGSGDKLASERSNAKRYTQNRLRVHFNVPSSLQCRANKEMKDGVWCTRDHGRCTWPVAEGAVPHSG